jgi:hypothetical protein
MAAVRTAWFYPCLAAPKGLKMFLTHSGSHDRMLKYTK